MKLIILAEMIVIAFLFFIGFIFVKSNFDGSSGGQIDIVILGLGMLYFFMGIIGSAHVSKKLKNK